MSRTYKDAPYWVRAYRHEKRAIPKDWRNKTDWRLNRLNGVDWQQHWNAIPGSFWDYYDGIHNPSVKFYAREENRKIRHTSKTMIRAGRYDDTPKPVRNAIWLST